MGEPYGEPEARTGRLALVPLRVEHAEEMAVVLGDPELYAFTGGEPPRDAGELRSRYERLAAGSPDPSVVWCNWVVAWRETGRLTGTVQATLTLPHPVTEQPHQPHQPHVSRAAEIAWVVGADWQGRGIAKEAARALVGLLGEEYGVTEFVAHVHPGHHASAAVASAAGLVPTDRMHEGERRWQLARSPTHLSP